MTDDTTFQELRCARDRIAELEAENRSLRQALRDRDAHRPNPDPSAPPRRPDLPPMPRRRTGGIY